MDYLYFVFATLIFLAVLLLIEGAYMTWNATRGAETLRLTQRLRMMSASESVKAVSITKKRVMSTNPLVQRLLFALPYTAALDRLLAQSGKSWTVAGFLGWSLAAALAAWAGTYWWPLPTRLAVSVGAALIPLQLVLRAHAKRLNRIETQLADALELMSRALRAGHAFPTAVKMVGEEMKDPIAAEFGTVFDEINFGISMQDALANLVNRVPSTDLRYFVVALMIQRETGGNLSELLDNIGKIVRERIKLLGQIQVLSAEGKMSAWVLGLLPFAAAGLIHLTNPDFLALLFTDSAGKKLLMLAMVMMVIGFFVMRKVIRIRV
jgi:tight adherence protein B